jgi:hypothetical protein
MEENVCLLIGPCPECGNGRLEPVVDGVTRNFLCRDCGNCWHAEFEWVHRVNPEACPGCPARHVCQTARRAFATSWTWPPEVVVPLRDDTPPR